MRTIMKNAVFAAGVLVLFGSATARGSTSPVLHADVPFPFVVNGQAFPAGKYKIERDDTSSILLIREEGTGHAAKFISTTPDGGKDPAGSRPALTFKRHENEYRLASVWESQGRGWDVAGR